MLLSVKNQIKEQKKIKIIASTVAVIILILIISIFFILINVDVNINNLEMPAVYAIYKIFPQIKLFYGIIILISIFTTAISLGISFLKNVTKTDKEYNIISIVLCVSSVIFSKFGFSNLVNMLYPILGIFGFWQMIIILLKS